MTSTVIEDDVNKSQPDFFVTKLILDCKAAQTEVLASVNKISSTIESVSSADITILDRFVTDMRVKLDCSVTMSS